MSEFRQDPVSEEWVLLAPERAKRPHDAERPEKRLTSPRASCPFEDLHRSDNWPPLALMEEGGKWQAAVIPNKYPALTHHAACPVLRADRFAVSLAGAGHHELLVTRDHIRDFSALPAATGTAVFQIFAERYQAMKEDPCMKYLSIFANWGPGAGASLTHPHYQLMALPVTPPPVERSLKGSASYFRKHRSCIHCDLIAAERRKKVRILGENKSAIAIAPFASHRPYEVKIFPKLHVAAFENSSAQALSDAAVLLQKVLRSMKKRLRDPDYNFYIHTAPLAEEGRFTHYHWHIEVVPHLAFPAGFELATGVELNVVDPDMAAKTLRL